MHRPFVPLTFDHRQGGPFLPLAIRFVASFAILILHFGLDWDIPENSAHEWIYVFFLAALFVESAFESARSTLATGSPFSVPDRPWVFINLFLLCFLVTILVSFHGVGRAGLATLYVFPVFASAFYVGIRAIIGVGALSVALYSICVLLFSNSTTPHLDYLYREIHPSEQMRLIFFTALQVITATLVVVTIRRRLETLGSNLTKSEAAVDNLSALYRNVVESMDSGLVTTDMNGMLTSANPSAERILQARMVQGQSLKMLGAIEAALQKGIHGINYFEHSIAILGGPEKIVGGTVSPLMDGENRQRGFLVLFQDLTDMKAMEAKMRLSERLATVGELSSKLAHEMRTPLASIMGGAQILRKQGSDAAIADKVLTILLRESERVGAVISDFLELANPRDIKLGPVWLPGLLEEVQATCSTDPRFAGLAVLVEKSADIWIRGEGLACHQVLTNLLSNSRKAVSGRPQPMIRVSQKIQSGKLELTVSDNGIGMDKIRAGDIFTPFHSGFSEGTGIGMSLVFQLAQHMGWEISVESEVGAGTAIKLIIPIMHNF
jgi:two-component system sensor histidine kinase PilS (NtrC family)